MNNRQRSIMLQLTMAEKPVTSAELGQRLGVSSRTIKADMIPIAAELAANGAKLVSRQNCGYSIEVTDKERFQTMYTLLTMKSGRFSAVTGEERLLYIARKLVGSRQGVLMGELEQELYLTRSALRTPVQEAVRFCESFHLQTTSAAGHGLRVVGEEHLIRMALTELFELHFHKAELDQVDAEYARWVGCEYQERQDIRHAFLKVLRESTYAMRDSATQRIAMYLIIARNRRRAGLRITLPSAWVAEICGLPIYAVAAEIYRVLQAGFAHYSMDTAETCFLAIFMLANLDPDIRRDPAQAAPMVAAQVRQTAGAMLRAVRGQSGAELAALPDAQPLLEQVILPILVGARYGLDGRQSFDYSYENTYLHMPLEMYYARLLAGELHAQTGCSISVTDLSAISCYVAALLCRVQYPVYPLRLLVTHPIGVDYARISAEGLWKMFPHLIQSITPVELYEIRGMDPAAYDAVLVGHVKYSQNKMFGYSYDAPAVPFLLPEQGRDFMMVHNELLTRSYRLESLMPPADHIRFQDGFLYYSPGQALQYLCACYAKDAESALALERRLVHRNRQFSFAQGSCAVIVAERSLCSTEALVLYRLQKPGLWDNHRIGWLLFLCVDGRQLPRVKAVSALLAMLTKNNGQYEQFAQCPQQAVRELLKKSVQMV